MKQSTRGAEKGARSGITVRDRKTRASAECMRAAFSLPSGGFVLHIQRTGLNIARNHELTPPPPTRGGGDDGSLVRVVRQRAGAAVATGDGVGKYCAPNPHPEKCQEASCPSNARQATTVRARAAKRRCHARPVIRLFSLAADEPSDEEPRERGCGKLDLISG